MKLLIYFLGYIIYPFSFLFPRNKKIWAFGSFRGAFNDNAKYLFIYVSENCPEINPIWLSSNKNTVLQVRQLGFNCYYIGSIKGILYSLRSKYWFFNSYTSDILFFTSGGSICINLWHGVGLKKIEFSVTKGYLSKIYVDKTFKMRFFYPQVYRRPNFFLSTTDFQSTKFAEAFRIDKSKCLNIGYPRNEILTQVESKRIDFIKKYEPKITQEIIAQIGQFKKTYIYMPTWRDSQKDIFAQSFDLYVLNQLMVTKNCLFILKPHANTKVDSNLISNLSNVLLINNNVDIYTILPYTNVLITDYSSVLYDYILMENKDVILYVYDFDQYVSQRDFNYPFKENVAGKMVYNFPDLIDCIENDDYKMDVLKRLEIKDRFWGMGTDDVCKAIIEKVIPPKYLATILKG